MAKRPPLTHFLCIPLLSSASRPQFEASSLRFREKLTSLSPPLDPNALGRAIRPIGTIHLTLGVMSLESQERINDATTFLRELDLRSLLSRDPSRPSLAEDAGRWDADGAASKTTAPSKAATTTTTHRTHLEAPAPLTVTLHSLTAMKQPQKTTSLYATPLDSTGRLLPFCETLRSNFVDAGFAHPENRPLKLHATILNTIYAQGVGKGRRKKSLELDARELIEGCEGFVWAEEVRLERIAICEMGAKMVQGNGDGKGDGEWYVEVAGRELP